MKNKNLINKPNEKDLPKLVEFACANGYNEYDILKPDKKKIYTAMLKKFFSDKTKTIYYLEDRNDNIAGLMLFEALDFDTKLFGVKTFKLTEVIIPRELKRKNLFECARSLIEVFMKEMRAINAQFIQCKLDIRNFYIGQVLEEHGFILASPDVTFLIDLERAALNTLNKKQGKTDYQVTFCKEEDVNELYRISKETYRTTRFHNDPNIPLEKANGMQGLWIKNCYHKKLADEIIVIKQGKEICGYVACVVVKDVPFSNNRKIGRIILIAVDKKFQGKGIGSVVIQESLKWFKQQGCDFVAVGTQLVNLPAVNFYQKNGFRLMNSVLSFHKWL